MKRIAFAPVRAVMTPTSIRQVTQRLPRRLYSDDAKPKPPSNYSAFYKTFGRPIFKVALMAILTYQIAYFGWTWLEQKEVRTDVAGKLYSRT
jgi:hypothetical protein